jgi:hypothetical protein
MYKLYKTLISCILLVAGSHHSVFAQTIRVSGAVTDEAGESLPGVSIMVKSTNNGTTSDTNGKYSLEVADGNAILVFSFVGFTTQTVEVANRTSINVSLVPDIAALGEVVVVSYGTQKKNLSSVPLQP